MSKNHLARLELKTTRALKQSPSYSTVTRLLSGAAAAKSLGFIGAVEKKRLVAHIDDEATRRGVYASVRRTSSAKKTARKKSSRKKSSRKKSSRKKTSRRPSRR